MYKLGKLFDLKASHIPRTRLPDLFSMLREDSLLKPITLGWHPLNVPIHASYQGWLIPSQQYVHGVFAAVPRVRVDSRRDELATRLQ